MTFEEYYEWFSMQEGTRPKESFEAKKPLALLQHKGTNVCMDVHCVCGHHSHFDTDFTYFLRCPKCDALYAVGHVLALHPLPKEQAEFILQDRPTMVQVAEPEPDFG
jgi:hypothetical protein